jgi:hypothetical protein
LLKVASFEEIVGDGLRSVIVIEQPFALTISYDSLPDEN